MANAAQFVVTVVDGKGKTSVMKRWAEVLDAADYAAGKTYESMGDNLLQDLEPNIDGRLSNPHWIIPVGFDFTPQEADPDSDVEEGAMFLWETEDGYTTRGFIPTFKESLLIAGTELVDLAQAVVQDWVNTMIDGPDAMPGIPEDRINMTTNRGEDISLLRAAYGIFKSSRGRRR